LGVVLVLGGAVPCHAAPPVLERIEVSGSPPVVRLHLSAEREVRARTLAAEGDLPSRIYLDFDGVALPPDLPRTVAGHGPLLRVRTGWFDRETVRVVLDLEQPVDFDVEPHGATVMIALTPKRRAPPVADATPPAPTAPPAPPVVQAPPPVAKAPRPARVVPEPSPPVVVLDAGHGGRDPGAAGIGGVLEKDVALAFAKQVADRLHARLPVAVFMTRTDDSFIPLERRIDVPLDATVFLSLHANACSDASVSGIEVFYGGGRLRPAGGAAHDSAAPSAALLGRRIEEALRAKLGIVRGTARPGSFRVLDRNPAPSALVEIAYLTDPADAERAQSDRYQALFADALVDGVAAFLRDSAPPL
jgi:N-acetylmuramoyl-L-alanine amidase